MTQEEFIKKLEESRYSYEIQGNKIVVTVKKSVLLRDLTSLPPGVEFRNEGGVYLDSLTSLPTDVKFNNGGYVRFNSLTSIPPGVEFRNGEGVKLESLTGDWFGFWKGNIKGIDSKRLLNAMISKGMFDRG